MMTADGHEPAGKMFKKAGMASEFNQKRLQGYAIQEKPNIIGIIKWDQDLHEFVTGRQKYVRKRLR